MRWPIFRFQTLKFGLRTCAPVCSPYLCLAWMITRPDVKKHYQTWMSSTSFSYFKHYLLLIYVQKLLGWVGLGGGGGRLVEILARPETNWIWQKIAFITNNPTGIKVVSEGPGGNSSFTDTARVNQFNNYKNMWFVVVPRSLVIHTYVNF